jgi:predicted nucleic-acid-binding protein
VTSVPTYLLDTNILLRFLRNDHPVFSGASRKLFEKARTGKLQLLIPFIAMVEAFHALRTQYKTDQALAAREMIKLINAPGVTLSAPAWVHDAVSEYMSRKVSFGDACIAAEARSGKLSVASFDSDFDWFPDVIRFEPK